MAKCECMLYWDIQVPFTGNVRADVVVVGESPGEKERQQRKPFMGDLGDISKECFREAGLSWVKAYIANSARCKVDTLTLSDSEIKNVMSACRPKLEKALHYVKPKVIIAMGAWAHYQVFNKKAVVKNIRGLWKWSDEFDCWVMTTFHPAFILRNRGKKPILVEDLKLVADFQARGYVMAKEEKSDLKWVEVTTIKPLLAKEKPFVVSLDTETIGLDWNAEKPIILCYSIGIKTGRAAVVRLFEECALEEATIQVTVKRVPEGKKKPIPTLVGVKPCADFGAKVKELVQLCEDEGIKKIMQHGSFDIHFIRSFVKVFADRDLTFRGYVLDTQAAAHVLDENLFTMAALETLQIHLTDFRNDYWRIFNETYKKDDMLSVPIDKLVFYSGGDSDTTYRVGKELLKKLKKKPRLYNYYQNMVHPALQVLLEMEKNGVRVDRKALPLVQKEVEQDIKKLEMQTFALVPQEIIALHKDKGISLTRKDFLGDVLFHEHGLQVSEDGLKKTKAQKVSLDKENRQTLQSRRLPKKAAK